MNRIFVFSGTGNSLWCAKEIAKGIGDCEITAMGSNGGCSLSGSYDRIGFVYPTYAGGMPNRVREFISHLDLQGNKNAYFFAVATCGRLSRARNPIAGLRHLLGQKGIALAFGERLDMFSNYVVGYDMRDTSREEADQSALDFKPILERIKNKEKNKSRFTEELIRLDYIGFRLIAANMDKNFNVSGACTGCGICKKVCPVNNIKPGQDGKPNFRHHCEHCMACIQCCPTRAINYKDKTQNRKRYTHPDISVKDLVELNTMKGL